MKIAHVVNLFTSPEGSDSRRIQEITLDTLRRAAEAAADSAQVELLSAQLEADRKIVPDFMTPTRDLDRTIQDRVVCSDKRRLPFIHDILQRACEATDADYIVYTNLDIAVYPSFYGFLAEACSEGIDALAVNRAQIPRAHDGVDVLHALSVDEILKLKNRSPHHGVDCVMFRRDKFPSWRNPEICVGYPPVGEYLQECVEYHAEHFVWFKDAIQTFHIGVDSDDTSPWKNLQGNEIWKRNIAQFEAARLYPRNPWSRHGFNRVNWLLRRTRWALVDKISARQSR